jgi:hypothetical protein
MTTANDRFPDFPPSPWTPIRAKDELGWHVTILDARYVPLHDHVHDREVSNQLGCVHALGPRLMTYVMDAADKGGKEAQAIVATYQRMLADLKAGKQPTPEQITRARHREP